jgi:tetratricopeptide (TPR) repeat protein
MIMQGVIMEENDVVTNVLPDFLEACIEETANHKEWNDMETPDHRHLTADEAKQEFKKNLRDPATRAKMEERSPEGLVLIMKKLGEYPNDRMCLKELEDAVKIIESTPGLLPTSGEPGAGTHEIQGEADELPPALKFNFSPETLSVFFDIGFKMYTENQIEEAICVFSFLSILNCYSPEVWLNLGLSHHLAMEWIPALQSLNIAGLLNPINPIPHFCSIECYLALNNKEKAQIAFQKAKELISDDNQESLAPIVEYFEALILHHP